MEAKEPWWASDPTIAAIRRGVLEEIEQARPQLPGPIGPDPVFVDIASGAGYSWAEIGRVLGASKQSPHRRFGDLG